MKLRILDADIHLIDLETRLPFKYGIATMTRAPHAFVRVRLEVDGRPWVGVAADHLPPKWFTKQPDQTPDAEIDEMLRVIEHAVGLARGLQAESVYQMWRQLDAAQARWTHSEGLPPLLGNFGTTLVERAVIEAFCRSIERPFALALRANAFQLALGEFDPRLAGAEPAALLPSRPRSHVIARHTVGLLDPLVATEVPADERLHDGLPQALDECIACYRLKHFKIKVSGRIDDDLRRLEQAAQVIGRHARPEFAFSLDGNEQFRSLDEFREYWQATAHADALQPFFEHLLFVEQPFHRDVALRAEVLGGLAEWRDRPAMIIDESDAEHDSLARALALGYCGTSHKNCKGVFRGVANACLLEQLRRHARGQRYIMSGEDLVNIGPVALLQDLAVAASLGVESIERNGHHYFAGLSAFPQKVQQQVLDSHGDLYDRTEEGWPTLVIRDGELDVRSVVATGLGVGFELDVEQFRTVEEWRGCR
jgi:hypothetical protein